jgi:hypothetical protein
MKPGQTIPMPKAGITLLPPWWAFILWAGKRIENRTMGVARRVNGWRGLIALTASKQPEDNDWEMVHYIIKDTKEAVKAAGNWRWEGPQPYTIAMMRERGGYVVGVAELIDVRANGSSPTDPWSVPEQAGLVLGHVAEIEPVPCIGGRSIFRFGACGNCGALNALEGTSLSCRKCKHVTPRAELGQPDVRVLRVFGPDGAEIR